MAAGPFTRMIADAAASGREAIRTTRYARVAPKEHAPWPSMTSEFDLSVAEEKMHAVRLACGRAVEQVRKAIEAAAGGS